MGDKTVPFKTYEGIRIVESGESSAHVRSIRDGTTIKLNVNSGVFTLDM